MDSVSNCSPCCRAGPTCLHTFYFLVTSHPILRVSTRVPILAAALAFLLFTLAACGGGETLEPVEPTEGAGARPPPLRLLPSAPLRRPGPPVRPALPPPRLRPRAVGGSPPPTSSPASTGAATPASTSAAPLATAPDEPTAVPAMVVPPGLLNARPCEEVFREMLAGYDGVERFDAELVTALSNGFVELRPDCLAQGWAPEFPDEPKVCEEAGDLPGGIHFKHNPRAQTRFGAPTQWIVDTTLVTGAGEVTVIRINVHLDRVPLSSDLPKSMNYMPGELVGGCWAYKGSIYPDGHSSGRWYRSFFKYRLRGESVIKSRVSHSNGQSRGFFAHEPARVRRHTPGPALGGTGRWRGPGRSFHVWPDGEGQVGGGRSVCGGAGRVDALAAAAAGRPVSGLPRRVRAGAVEATVPSS